jgi:hypothetical protein
VTPSTPCLPEALHAGCDAPDHVVEIEHVIISFVSG